MFSKFLKQLFKNKFTAFITLLVVIIGGYLGYQSLTRGTSGVEYVTTSAEQGTLVLSISGSGQVSVSDQVDIKPKVTGDIVTFYVTQGQEVKAGTLLTQIDSRDAQRAVRDAETSLETAQLELEELVSPPDELELMKAENSLAQAKESRQKAEDNIEKAYEDVLNTIANAFLDLPTIITGLRDVLYSLEIGKSEITLSGYELNIGLYRSYSPSGSQIAKENYQKARDNYDQNFDNYKDASRYSEKEVIEGLLNETTETTKSVAEAVKSEANLLDFIVDVFSNQDKRVYSKITEYQSDLKSYTSKTNSHLLSLLSIQRSLKDNREAILNAERSIEEKEFSLAELKAGPGEFDIRSKKIAIQQKEDVLLAAKETLADHFIRAPFDGVIAKVNVKKGDSASSGTVLAILITTQKIAEITLNEIDVAKIEIDQPVTLTFDAIENVTLTGRVVEIDTLGMVTQGIVTYGVKIAFDTQDERIKPGMTTNASIVTERKDGIVLVPNAAVQTQGGQIFVEVMQDGIPQSVPVEVGLSNEVSTEIVNGLQDGAEIVIARLGGEGGTQTANISQPFRFPGFGGSGGGFRGGGGSDQH